MGGGAVMTLFRMLTGACAAVVLAGCATMDIQTEGASSVDFAGLRRYGWLSGPVSNRQRDARPDHAFIDANVREYVDAGLARKGFTEAVGERPDFLVGYSVTLEEKVDVGVVDREYEYEVASGWAFTREGGWAFGLQEPDVAVRQYDEGTLTLHVVDPNASKLIWRGVARAEIDRSISDREKKAKVKRAVARLLKHFPDQGKGMGSLPIVR